MCLGYDSKRTVFVIVIHVERQQQRVVVGVMLSEYLWVLEVDDSAVLFEHVDLLDGGDPVHPQSLQTSLQLLVVSRVALGHVAPLPPRRPLTPDTHLTLQLR